MPRVLAPHGRGPMRLAATSTLARCPAASANQRTALGLLLATLTIALILRQRESSDVAAIAFAIAEPQPPTSGSRAGAARLQPGRMDAGGAGDGGCRFKAGTQVPCARAPGRVGRELGYMLHLPPQYNEDAEGAGRGGEFACIGAVLLPTRRMLLPAVFRSPCKSMQMPFI